MNLHLAVPGGLRWRRRTLRCQWVRLWRGPAPGHQGDRPPLCESQVQLIRSKAWSGILTGNRHYATRPQAVLALLGA